MATVFLLVLLFQLAVAIHQHSNSVKKDDPSINLNNTSNEKIQPVPILNIRKPQNASNNLDGNQLPEIVNNSFKNNEVESGALMRGVYVFVAFGVLFFMYLAIKTYRNRKKPNVIVRKYGVRTRRSDLEMEPLPLDDNDEDDTIFDAGLLNRP